MSAPPQRFVELAITEAACRPARLSCAKSNRGVVIFDSAPIGCNAYVLAVAGNGPPPPFRCAGDDACQAACNRVAIHAEERAIMRTRCDPRGAELVHVKAVDGELVASGPPSCWQCSRMIVEAQLSRVWLYGVEGWSSWSAGEFHRATLRHCGLPTGPEARGP